MEFKPGIIVSMRHYSNSNLKRGIIIESTYDTIRIQLDQDTNNYTFKNGDPIALGCELEGLVYISSCIITSIDDELNQIVLKSDTLETLANKRLFERFPASFNATVKLGSSKTEYSVLVKNISFNGMLVCSKTDFPIYQEMKMDFNLGSDVSLKAVIIRKSKENDQFEYGLKLVYTDPHTPAIIKKFLNQLKKEQEAYISTYQHPAR